MGHADEPDTAAHPLLRALHRAADDPQRFVEGLKDSAQRFGGSLENAYGYIQAEPDEAKRKARNALISGLAKGILRRIEGEPGSRD